LPLFLPHRASVSQECITAYNELKLSKKFKYIIFKLSDDNKEIVVEEASDDKDWENFREKLINATTKSKTVCPAHLAAAVMMRDRDKLISQRVPSARAPATPSTTSSTALPPARASGMLAAATTSRNRVTH
jgi:spore cortex formation protein SpoVR/YcgB (stage V sporulation)